MYYKNNIYTIKKQICLLLSILFFPLIIMATRPKKKIIRYTPQNTIIAFDLHDVLLIKNYREMAKVLRKCKHKSRIIKGMPHTLWQVIKATWYCPYPDNYFKILTEKTNPYMAELTREVAIAAQEPNDKLIAIIDNLKRKGYELHVLSNIWPSTYNHIKGQYPKLFEKFDKICMVDNNNEPIVKKPNPIFFKDYIKKITKKNKHKHVILIDDKRRNTRAARSVNITGIVFKNSKQLQRELKNLGINTAK